MKKRKLIIRRYLFWSATLAVMAVIFVFSSQNGQTSRETSGSVIEIILKMFVKGYDDLSAEAQLPLIEEMQFFIRKAAHFTAYFLIGIFSSIAIDTYEFKSKIKILVPAITGLVYAVSDEIHQGLVPERSPQLTDVLLDFCGVLVGIALIRTAVHFFNDKKNKKLQEDTFGEKKGINE